MLCQRTQQLTGNYSNYRQKWLALWQCLPIANIQALDHSGWENERAQEDSANALHLSNHLSQMAFTFSRAHERPYTVWLNHTSSFSLSMVDKHSTIWCPTFAKKLCLNMIKMSSLSWVNIRCAMRKGVEFEESCRVLKGHQPNILTFTV